MGKFPEGRLDKKNSGNAKKNRKENKKALV